MRQPRTDVETELSSVEARRLLHELRVHQVELEAQNEELRSAQSELQQTRTQYFDLYDLAPVAYFSLDALGVIARANLTATILLGLDRTRSAGQALVRYVHLADRARFLDHREQLLQSGLRQTCELRMLRDQTAIWVRLESTVTDEADGTRHWRATVSDISDRHRAEQALRASEARYRMLFETSRDALLTLAPPTWRFSSGNAAAVELFGVAGAAALRELTLWSAAPERQRDGMRSELSAQEMIALAMREGARLFEWQYQRASGEVRVASVLLQRLELQDSSLLQATVRDVTEAKAAELRLAKADRLATMGMLAASVAHEINNPLTYVTFSLERCTTLLAQLSARQVSRSAADRAVHEADAAAREALDGIQRIASITRGLGKFSRIEGTAVTLCSLNAAVDDAAVIVGNEIKFRAKLVKQLDSLPPILASAGKLAQILLNLLLNAAHAIEEGDPEHNRITVRTWSESNSVFAEVSDTGSGIPSENLERIFEPFFTTKEGGKGSGLGLSICRSIAAEFGGSLTVQSTLGAGSQFLLQFPAQQASAKPTPAAASGADAEATAQTIAGRILVVDDEPAIRSVMRHLLGEWHEVVAVASGAEARALLERDANFDLLLFDLMMPRMSGMELHAWLASHDRELAHRVIFISGGAFTPKAVSYLETVDNLRIDKPFDIQELVAIVNARIAAVRRAAAPDAQPPLSPR